MSKCQQLREFKKALQFITSTKTISITFTSTTTTTTDITTTITSSTSSSTTTTRSVVKLLILLLLLLVLHYSSWSATAQFPQTLNKTLPLLHDHCCKDFHFFVTSSGASVSAQKWKFESMLGGITPMLLTRLSGHKARLHHGRWLSWSEAASRNMSNQA